MRPGRYANILETVGETPVVRLSKIAPADVEVYVKVEAFNPLGSVKDRMALGVIEEAERSGALSPGDTVVEATSGNTGLGLAMVCAQKGYPLVVVMAENFSLERRKMMRFLGAKVVLTPASDRGIGMLNKAAELAATHGWFLPRQFENEANADAHSRTTAREILRDFEGHPLDYWVTGFGTGGTLKGVARELKRERPETRVIVAEPDNSRMLASGIEQGRDVDGAPNESHPAFRTHLVQGWAPDFIPKLAEDAQATGLVDGTVPVSGDEALSCARELARQEGIFTGISGGATCAGALRLARHAAPGSTLLCMLPDTGERYLSTPLFADISVDMDDSEIAVSESTPSHQFGRPSPSAPAAPVVSQTPAEVDEKAKEFIERTLADPEQPVVVFSLEWCEFCWAVRRLFDAMNLSFTTIEIDSAEAQVDNWGGRVRDCLATRTGSHTAPQVFIGGKYRGGSTDVLAAFEDGSLQRWLREVGVAFDDLSGRDAQAFLPDWLHPRE